MLARLPAGGRSKGGGMGEGEQSRREPTVCVCATRSSSSRVVAPASFPRPCALSPHTACRDAHLRHSRSKLMCCSTDRDKWRRPSSSCTAQQGNAAASPGNPAPPFAHHASSTWPQLIKRQRHPAALPLSGCLSILLLIPAVVCTDTRALAHPRPAQNQSMQRGRGGGGRMPRNGTATALLQLWRCLVTAQLSPCTSPFSCWPPAYLHVRERLKVFQAGDGRGEGLRRGGDRGGTRREGGRLRGYLPTGAPSVPSSGATGAGKAAQRTGTIEPTSPKYAFGTPLYRARWHRRTAPFSRIHSSQTPPNPTIQPPP